MNPSDKLIERWVKAYKIPLPVYSPKEALRVPTQILEMAVHEKWEQVYLPKEIDRVTDSEALVYLLSKQSDYSFDDVEKRITGHLLYKMEKRYQKEFPYMNSQLLEKYSSLDSDYENRLIQLKKYLYGKKEEFYKATLESYFRESFDRFGVYLDREFLAPKPRKGDLG